MQKYIKNDLSEIRYFEDDTSIAKWIDPKQYRLMTSKEILKHESNPHTGYHKWDGAAWVDNRTDDEITEYNRSLLPSLTKRQFSLYLFDIEKYDQVMDAINANPRFKIEFDAVTNIERLSPTVSTMAELLGWSNEEIDVMWEQAALLQSQ